MRLRRIIKRWTLIGLIAAGLVVLLANRWVINSTSAYIYTDWALLPDNPVAVVLGTSQYTRRGEPNKHFEARIQAAAELYRLGKVRHLIVSGSNPDATYNEPRRMWQALVREGVPPEAITMDFAGFRTLDSMARAEHVFGLNRFTVITQKYHARRAVFIGRKMNMQVIAYAAPGDRQGPALRPRAREVFARVKAVFDLFVLGTEPRFLGDPVAVTVT